MSTEKLTTPTILIIVFLHQLSVIKTQSFLIFKGSYLKQKIATFTPSNVMIFFLYELYTCSRDLNSGFTLKDCFFGGVKSAKNFDLDKYVCSGYGIGFESHLEFFFLMVTWATIGVVMSSSVYIDNKRKNILIIGKGPPQGLDDTTLTAETQFQFFF